MFKGYPTLEAFRARWRLIKSFEHMIASSVNDDTLQAHADRHQRFFADGSVNVDVITFMGKDPRSGAWVADGMAKARERAAKALAEIGAAGKTFDQVLEARGEYYQLDSASIAPKPVQDPLPLWVGGSAQQAIERTAKWGTGWQAGIRSTMRSFSGRASVVRVTRS